MRRVQGQGIVSRLVPLHLLVRHAHQFTQILDGHVLLLTQASYALACDKIVFHAVEFAKGHAAHNRVLVAVPSVN